MPKLWRLTVASREVPTAGFSVFVLGLIFLWTGNKALCDLAMWASTLLLSNRTTYQMTLDTMKKTFDEMEIEVNEMKKEFEDMNKSWHIVKNKLQRTSGQSFTLRRRQRGDGPVAMRR